MELYRVWVVQKQSGLVFVVAVFLFLIKPELTVAMTVSYDSSDWPVWSKPSTTEHNRTIVTENGTVLGRPSHVSQLPRTEGEPLTLTETQPVSRACRIHWFVLQDDKPAGVKACFCVCVRVCVFYRRWGTGTILEPVNVQVAFWGKLFWAECVKGDRGDGTREPPDRRSSSVHYCRNNQGIVP